MKKLNLQKLKEIEAKATQEPWDYESEFRAFSREHWKEMIEALEEAKKIIKYFPHETDCKRGLNYGTDNGYFDYCKCIIANEGKEWLERFEE